MAIVVDDTCSSCHCWAWRGHCCSNNAVRHGLGTSAWEYLLPFSSARACTDCLESSLCPRASQDALLHFPPPSLPCSTIAPALHPPAPFCLLSPVKTITFAKPFTDVLNQLSSSHVLLSIHILFCLLSAALSPSREHRAHVCRLLQQICCFHHDAVPRSLTATTSDLPLLSSLVWRPGPPKHQGLLFSNLGQVLRNSLGKHEVMAGCAVVALQQASSGHARAGSAAGRLCTGRGW